MVCRSESEEEKLVQIRILEAKEARNLRQKCNTSKRNLKELEECEVWGGRLRVLRLDRREEERDQFR